MIERARWWAEVRSPPLIGAMLVLVGGMAFSLLWVSLVHGGPAHLRAPGDIWGLSASSSAILNGHFSGIYYPNGALTSPPALEYLLVPVLALAKAIGLAPIQLGKGSANAWLLLGPAAACIASTALFAIDALARAWHMSLRARYALALIGGYGVANVVFGWGHPEDCASVALVLWAALLCDREGEPALSKVAWLLGLAIAFQPLAIMGVVPILAAIGWRRLPTSAVRLAAPSLVALVVPLFAEFHRTLFVMIRQPFQPEYISFTPLTRLAPSIGAGVAGGGPTRLCATVLGAVAAYVVCRKRRDLNTVVFMIVVAVALRLLLETELNWYYFWPVCGLSLLLALRQGWTRFTVCGAAMFVSIAIGNHRVHSIGLWWPTIMALMLTMVVTASPLRITRRATPAMRTVHTSSGADEFELEDLLSTVRH